MALNWRKRKKPTPPISTPPKKLLAANEVDVQQRRLELVKNAMSNKQCDLVWTTSPPTEATLSSLPGTSQAAYVRCNNELYYVHKQLGQCSKINISPNELNRLAPTPTTPATSGNPRILTDTELTAITTATGHTQLEIISPITPAVADKEKGRHFFNLTLKGTPDNCELVYYCYGDGSFGVSVTAGPKDPKTPPDKFIETQFENYGAFLYKMIGGEKLEVESITPAAGAYADMALKKLLAPGRFNSVSYNEKIYTMEGDPLQLTSKPDPSKVKATQSQASVQAVELPSSGLGRP